jgi:predicted GNAT family N-acyltransferase
MPVDPFRVRAADWARDSTPLMAVRRAVFVEEQGVPPALEWDGLDPQAWHWLAEAAGGSAIGVARLLPTGQVGRMAVLPPWRRRGVGAALLAAVLRDAARYSVTELWLNAQCAAEPFYARAGFAAEGPVFMEAGIPHQRMRRHREVPDD